MVAIGRSDRYEFVERPVEAPAIVAVVHGLVFVIPVWTFVASILLVLFVH